MKAASEGENRGSTFTVSLPAQRPSRLLSHPPSEANAADELSTIAVLVVDDDPSARDLFSTILEDHGARVHAASSAAAAIRLMTDHHPDALVVDIAMPAEDGLEFLRRVRADENSNGRRPAPAIAVTAYAETSRREAVLQAGFAEQLSKPILPRDLIAAVLRAVRT